MERRNFIRTTLLFIASTQVFSNNLISATFATKSNFKFVYSSKKLKDEFYKFLKYVFNVYPENQFHILINDTTIQKSSDHEIYVTAQSKLDEISPVLSEVRYQLPALMKQKEEMAKQTVKLLGKGVTFDGYLEIGSSGRYLDYLEERVKIIGKRYYADGKDPGYSFSEMIDRGQISKGAEYIPLANYQTRYSQIIAPKSLDLITIYIGFHHCPLELRVPFISSIRDTMRVGGKLILRDHDCTTEEQRTIVALAHDVFNMGTNQSWEYNNNEIRNFYSLEFICDFVEKLGFKFNERTLFQPGDPTKNALMVFTKL